ncbi:MAG TPA: AAA family ATPase [Pyrinomonadaceae bacterium]|nr:AAA family ATPase [Pyrinomonadaceae bacterium]
MKNPDSQSPQILPEKIAPPTELPRVSRERLLDTLRDSVATCNSTVIIGRAGTGKTMLATDFARQCGRRSAWYKVDAPDAELKTFFQYLCASVATVRAGFGRKTMARLGETINSEDVPLLVEYFVYELLEWDDPLLIVVDDLHRVYDAEWVVPFFRRLLPLLPPEVHVILIGRSLPPAPLWRMRSKQTLCLIDEPSLAFSPHEAEQLFSSYGMGGEETAAALEKTRGRASNLSALARAASVEAEAARLVSAREGRRARPLHLIRGFKRKSSMGTA